MGKFLRLTKKQKRSVKQLIVFFNFQAGMCLIFGQKNHTDTVTVMKCNVPANETLYLQGLCGSATATAEGLTVSARKSGF